MRTRVWASLLTTLSLPAAGRAQGYVLRLDSQAQVAEYRGVLLDSVLVGDTVAGSTGGPVTVSGYAVSCSAGLAYCSFYRPGALERGAPLTTRADLSLWGLGVPGLSFRASARFGVAVGDATAWPGTTPAVELDEGYAQYATEHVIAQLGRQLVQTRLASTGFDGGLLTVGTPMRGLAATAYGGWGLAQGVALPVTSPALNPLNDYQPTDRQLVAGFKAGFTGVRADVQFNYLREVDPSVEYFVAERAGIDVVLRPLRGWNLTGGADYDIAQGWWGSAEAALQWLLSDGRVTATLGVRRYRPEFDLWTIWGAFSPVPYRAADGSVAVAPIARLRLRVTGETYQYEATGASTALVLYQTSGWRFTWGATYLLGTQWTWDAGYNAEFGPGASSRGLEGAVTFVPTPALSLSVQAGSVDSPLEFRYDDASLNVYGVSVQYRAASRLRLQMDAAEYVQTQARPDAAAFDWNQVRVNAGFVIELGGGAGADLAHLPPAVQRMPGGRTAR